MIALAGNTNGTGRHHAKRYHCRDVCRTGIRVVVMSSPDGVTAGVEPAFTTQQNG